MTSRGRFCPHPQERNSRFVLCHSVVSVRFGLYREMVETALEHVSRGSPELSPSSKSPPPCQPLSNKIKGAPCVRESVFPNPQKLFCTHSSRVRARASLAEPLEQARWLVRERVLPVSGRRGLARALRRVPPPLPPRGQARHRRRQARRARHRGVSRYTSFASRP